MSQKIPVVLLQSVKGLGNKDEIVNVAIVYAKNVLFAQWKAKPADKGSLAVIEQKKQKSQQEKQNVISQLEDLQLRRDTSGPLRIEKKATDAGHLYEKVSAKDVAHAIHAQAQIEIDVSWITLASKIDNLGEYKIDINYQTTHIVMPLVVEKI